MDSILSNTTWSFIKDIGYEIKEYMTTSFNASNRYSATITVPSFSLAFFDIISSVGSVATMTLRPIRCDISKKGTGFWDLFSIWLDGGGSSIFSIVPSHINGDLISRFSIVDSTTIQFTGGSSATCSNLIFFYVVE